MKKMWKGERVGYLYILPALLFMSVFIFYPIIYNVIISLQDVTVTTLVSEDKKFVALANYAHILTDKEFWKSLRITLIFTVACIFFQFTFGFTLALVFKKNTRPFKFMKAVMLVPYIIPATVTSILFKFFFSVKGGVINEILLITGLIDKRIDWLLSPNTALISVIVANIWCGIPFFMILLSTGLAGIPEDYYESAQLDGANFIQKFVYITVPSIKSSIKAVLVLGVVYTFRCYELVYVMTSGGPVNGTELMTIFSYKTSFTNYMFSNGAAISNILLLVLFFVGLLYIKMIGNDEEM